MTTCTEELQSELNFVPSDRYFSLRDVVHALVQHSYHDLYVLSDLLANKTDPEKRSEIVRYALVTRHRFTLLLAVVLWLRKAGPVFLANKLYNYVNRQIFALSDTADQLFQFTRFELPHWSIGALDVLSSVSLLSGDKDVFSLVPSSIVQAFKKEDLSEDISDRDALNHTNDMLRYYIAMSDLTSADVMWCMMDGYVIMLCEPYFEADLTLRTQRMSWHIVNIRLFSQLGTKVYIRTTPRQNNQLIDRIHKLMGFNSDPLKTLLFELKGFCISLRIEEMARQFKVDMQQAPIGKNTVLTKTVPGELVVVEYWSSSRSSVRELWLHKVESAKGVELTLEHRPLLNVSIMAKLSDLLKNSAISLLDIISSTIQSIIDLDMKYIMAAFVKSIDDVRRLKDPDRMVFDYLLPPCRLTILPCQYMPSYIMTSNYGWKYRKVFDRCELLRIAQEQDIHSDPNNTHKRVFSFSRICGLIKCCRSVLIGHGFIKVLPQLKNRVIPRRDELENYHAIVRCHKQWTPLHVVILLSKYGKGPSLFIAYVVYDHQSNRNAKSIYKMFQWPLDQGNVTNFSDHGKFMVNLSTIVSYVKQSWPLFLIQNRLRRHPERIKYKLDQNESQILISRDILDASVDSGQVEVFTLSIQYALKGGFGCLQDPAYIVWTLEATVRMPSAVQQKISANSVDSGIRALRFDVSSGLPDPGALEHLLTRTILNPLKCLALAEDILYLQASEPASSFELDLKTLTGKDVSFLYGQKRDFTGVVRFELDGRKRIIFPCTKYGHTNPHNAMTSTLECKIFSTPFNPMLSLSKVLNRTIIPIHIIADLPNNLRGPAFTLTDNVEQSFSVFFDTPLQWRISWGSTFMLMLDFSLDDNLTCISDPTQSIAEALRNEQSCWTHFDYVKTYLTSWMNAPSQPQLPPPSQRLPFLRSPSLDPRYSARMAMFQQSSMHDPQMQANYPMAHQHMLMMQHHSLLSPGPCDPPGLAPRFGLSALAGHGSSPAFPSSPCLLPGVSPVHARVRGQSLAETHPAECFGESIEGTARTNETMTSPGFQNRDSLVSAEGCWWCKDERCDKETQLVVSSTRYSAQQSRPGFLAPFFVGNQTLGRYFAVSPNERYRPQCVTLQRLFASTCLMSKLNAIIKRYVLKNHVSSRVAVVNQRDLVIHTCSRLPLSFTFSFDPIIPAFMIRLIPNGEPGLTQLWSPEDLQTFERYMNTIMMFYPCRCNVAASFLSLLLISHPNVVKDIYNLFKFEITSSVPWKVRWHSTVPMGFDLKPYTPSYLCLDHKAFLFVRLYLRLQRADNQGIAASRCFMLPLSYDLTTGVIDVSVLRSRTTTDDSMRAQDYLSRILSEYSRGHCRSTGSTTSVLYLTLRELVCRLPMTFGATREECHSIPQGAQLLHRSPAGLQLISPVHMSARLLSPSHRSPILIPAGVGSGGDILYRQVSPQYPAIAHNTPILGHPLSPQIDLTQIRPRSHR